jgi:SNF2 family DNA or RNA helicase
MSLNGMNYVKMDGSMTTVTRKREIQRFKDDPSILVFLISIQAGGVGLNLVVANTVFIIEPWWNLAVEHQAIDRVHRIGQDRPVEVVRFIC